MAPTEDGLLESGTTVTVSIADRMESAFLDYSMSVIVGRALPDVRDGLKPVQRRILYSMYESGLYPDRPYRKCASAVGEVMKTYHPHGDSSIYDALVRMGQDFSTRELLVDGHGNFGSVDGDPPAAMRYTEARLSALSMQMLEGIREGTVDMVENYDGYSTEPTVLPSRFPNMLVNGSSGIAVGMATNIPPHNLGEVISACLHLVKKPESSVDELMQFVPAPDFPTAGRIVQSDGIKQAYVSGRGAVTVEAVASTEVRAGNLPRIIVTEIPYQVNKATLLEKIAALVVERKLDSVRDLRDESSRDGMRVVIELKRGEDPARTLASLYKMTDLRTNFNVNMVALVDGAPRTVGLKEALTAYIAHQRDVLTRRTQHRLERALARLHIVDGLLKALDNLDDVIATIRRAKDSSVAKQRLMNKFVLSEVQAQAVLDMQLRRLAAMERQTLKDERNDLQSMVKELRHILGDSAVLDGLFVDEMSALKKAFATARRSRLVDGNIDADAVLSGGSDAGFEAQHVTVVVTSDGYVKPVAKRRRNVSHKHDTDSAVAVLRCDTDTTLLVVEQQGGSHKVTVGDFPVQKPSQRGTHMSNLLAATLDSPVAGVVAIPDELDGMSVVTVSASGLVKHTLLAEFVESRQRSLQAAGVKGADRLVGVALAHDTDHLLVAHDGGFVTRFAMSEVRPMGRTAAGVAAIKVPSGCQVMSLSVVPSSDDSDVQIVTFHPDGTAKRSPLADYPVKGRAGKGLKAAPGKVVWCGAVPADFHADASDGWDVFGVEHIVEGARAWRGEPFAAGTVSHVVVERQR